MSRKKRTSRGEKPKVAKAPRSPSVDRSLFIDDVETDKHEIISLEGEPQAEPAPLDSTQSTQVFKAEEYLAKLPEPRPLGADETPATEIDVRLRRGPKQS